jgi:threonine dehydrogenase-like Zn-dependent dehydrogenase
VGLAATIADCLAGTRRGGVVCLVGMGAPRVELGAFAITTEEHELIGSFCYSDAEFIEAATWVCSAPQVLDLLISRTVPLSEGPAAFAALAGHDGTPGKVLVAFGDRSPA